MSDQRNRLLETLLDLHRQRDPDGVLRRLLDGIGPVYGRAVACCYLADRPGGNQRLAFLDDSEGKITARRWRPEFHAPPIFLGAEALRASPLLPRCGGPVKVADGLPRLLDGLWAPETLAMLRQGLEPRYSVVEPVCAPGGMAGLVMLFVAGDWPVDVAVAGTAHAAVAVSTILERLAVQPAQERFARGLIEHIVIREIRHAHQQREALSLLVVELQDDDPSPERLAAYVAPLAEATRQPDMIGYLDRRRLLVLLPDTPAGGAAQFVRRLHRLIGADAGPLYVGAATFPEDGRELDELVRTALSRLQPPAAVPATPPAQSGAARAMRRFSTADEISPEERAALAGARARDVSPVPDRRDLVERDDTHSTFDREPRPAAGADAAARPDEVSPEVVVRTSGAAGSSGDGRAEPSGGGSPEPVAEAGIVDGAPAAMVLVRVAPLGEDEVAGWQVLLARLPAVLTATPSGYDGYTAGFDVGTDSVARLMAQMGRLGEKAAAIVTPTISGEIHVTLRPAAKPVGVAGR